jgi:hypothetical protein
MTAEELIRHTFPWELAPGVPADPVDPADPVVEDRTADAA